MTETEIHTGRIRCHSGVFYDYENPTPDMIRLEDIAHQLSNTCRFSGACDPYYSVAEHSVLVSRLAKGAEVDGLLHDTPEAYLWDIPRPAKHLYGKVYAELTVKCEKVIAEHFGRVWMFGWKAEAVHEADTIALNYEGNTIMPNWEAAKPEIPAGVLDWRLGLPPTQAKELFLRECARLGISPKPDYAPPLPS